MISINIALIIIKTQINAMSTYQYKIELVLSIRVFETNSILLLKIKFTYLLEIKTNSLIKQFTYLLENTRYNYTKKD